MVFCMQNNVIRIRITSLYGSPPTFVVFACKTATLGLELQVSMSPRPHLLFFAFKTATLCPELIVSMGPRPYLSFCASKTARLAHSLHGSQTSPAALCMRNKVISFRITNLYGSQPSFVVFACKTATFGSNYKYLWFPDLTYGFLHSKQRL